MKQRKLFSLLLFLSLQFWRVYGELLGQLIHLHHLFLLINDTTSFMHSLCSPSPPVSWHNYWEVRIQGRKVSAGVQQGLHSLGEVIREGCGVNSNKALAKVSN